MKNCYFMGFFKRWETLDTYLFYGDDNLLGQLALLVLDNKRQLTFFFACLHYYNQLPGKELHGGLGEGFQTGGVAVADSTECACSRYLERQLVSGIRDERAILVNQADGDECQVVAIGFEI